MLFHSQFKIINELFHVLFIMLRLRTLIFYTYIISQVWLASFQVLNNQKSPKVASSYCITQHESTVLS